MELMTSVRAWIRRSAALASRALTSLRDRCPRPQSDPAVPTTRVVVLEPYEPPVGLRLHKMHALRTGRPYQIAFSVSDSEYESAIAAADGPDINARLLMTVLGGSGTLVDVGANIGSIAIPAAVAGSSVIAIEMSPPNCL